MPNIVCFHGMFRFVIDLLEGTILLVGLRMHFFCNLVSNLGDRQSSSRGEPLKQMRP